MCVNFGLKLFCSRLKIEPTEDEKAYFILKYIEINHMN